MRVLISAYSCEPNRGSEPGVGWNIAREIANHHEVWVLTRPDESGDIIAAELAKNPVENLHFIYCNLPLIGGLWRLNQSGAMQIHYYIWQIQAYFVAKAWHQKIGFDVAHHVTFVRYSSPCFLAFLPIPLVWGPVGGGESAPKHFWQAFSWRNRVYETLRAIWRSIGEADPFTRMTARRSAIAYATTEDTAQRIRLMGADHVQCFSESGLSQQDIQQLAACPPPNASPVRFISIARLLHWKGFHLGLQAFAAAQLPDAEYWILGDGPEQDRLQALAESLNIANQVKIWGRLPREQVLEKLSNCSVLVHPSLHDSGGWVCLEAMAAGRPVICLDIGGPAQQVTEQTGIKVATEFVEGTVQAMAQAMQSLAANPEQRVAMGKAGQQRVSEFYTWQAKGQSLSNLYRKLVPLPSATSSGPASGPASAPSTQEPTP
jgi:glycosyltransferase involved in cell wall biosynthesis